MQTDEIYLSQTDRETIKEIVKHYPPGERSRTIRKVFRQETTLYHYLFLGVLIGQSVTDHSGNVLKMKNVYYTHQN